MRKIILRGTSYITKQQLTEALRLRGNATVDVREGFAYVEFQQDKYADEFIRRNSPSMTILDKEVFVNYVQEELPGENDGSDDISDEPHNVLLVQEWEGNAQQLFNMFYPHGAKHAALVTSKQGDSLMFGFVVFANVKDAHSCLLQQSQNVAFAHMNSLQATDDSTWVYYLKTLSYWDDETCLQWYPQLPANTDDTRPAEFYNPEFGSQLDDIDQFITESRKQPTAVEIEDLSWGADEKPLESRSGLMSAFSKKSKLKFDISTGKDAKRVKLEELEQVEVPLIVRRNTPDNVIAERHRQNLMDQTMASGSFEEDNHSYDDLPEEVIQKPTVKQQMDRYHRDITVHDLIETAQFVPVNRVETRQDSSSADEDVDEDDEGNLVVAIPLQDQFAVKDKLMCILCQRKFDNLPQLYSHNSKSELHKQRYDRFVNEIKQFHAQEAIRMFDLQINHQIKQKKKPIVEPQMKAGAKLLERIGWQGEGLGRNQQGRKDIVAADQHPKGKGIGYQQDD